MKKPKALPMIECESCHKKIQPTAKNQKICNTKSCKLLSYSRNYHKNKKPIPKVKCDSCGEWFVPYKHGQLRHRARKCLNIYQGKQRAKRRGGKYQPANKIIICSSCGLPMYANAHNQKVHAPADSDCFKYYAKTKREDKWIAIGNRYRQRKGISESKIDNDKTFMPDVDIGHEYRSCLKCDEQFMSTSKTNRICDRCKTNNNNYRYEPNSVNMVRILKGGGSRVKL